MSIKKMLVTIMAIIVLGMLALMFSTQQLVQKIESSIEASRYVADVKADMLILRKDEKDFLSRKSIKYTTQFDSHFQDLNNNLKLLESKLTDAKINFAEKEDLVNAFNQYKEGFEELTKIQQQIGLDENSGAYGKLRNAAHNFQVITQESNEPELERQLLLLRKYEKDFMLRYDIKYAEQFSQQVSSTLSTLKSSQYAAISADLSSMLNAYHASFEQFVSLSEQKGLNDNQGVIGKLRATIKQTETLLALEAEKLQQEVATVRDETKYTLTSLNIGLALLISVLVLFIANRITSRLKQVTDTMNDIAQGEGDLRVKLDESGKDEIAELGQAFNIFVGKIHATVTTVAHSAEQLATTSEEMSVVMTQAQEGAYKQQHDISQISASMEEMNVTVQDITLNSTQAEEAATNARKEVYQGCEVSDISINNVTELANDVGSTTGVIKKLVTHSQDIGGVLKVIQEIADQTNLLALNAAIEAARAGESGRGFAVVADEVRTLAMRTQEATKEILTITDGIQADAETATKVMVSNEKQAMSTVSQAKLANDALISITSSVEIVTDMNNQIAVATEQQSQTSNEISHHMADISHICEESAAGIEQLSTANKELVAMTMNLKALVGQFKL
ncbi:methyl-accepting chemotaxis protein [Vibrio sp. MACH09]|uniref:methyl-accepting chemotaxis protein n=1 Tax=Vibrio sp. MACH09 TaxID=3025122 RepID=UPI00278DEE58|nr:methyl-accepting chemotaxis protein [Vibrio sp. MACH09]GLO59847.1 methyl-accepting chemotaxis protein [Vibrio sp. MACH09]